MDVFDELLRGVRGSGAVFGRSVLRAVVGAVHDGAYLALCLPLRGGGWIVPEGGEPLRVGVGEAAIVRGPEPFVFTDDPANRTGRDPAAGVREVLAGAGTSADDASEACPGPGVPTVRWPLLRGRFHR